MALPFTRSRPAPLPAPAAPASLPHLRAALSSILKELSGIHPTAPLLVSHLVTSLDSSNAEKLLPLAEAIITRARVLETALARDGVVVKRDVAS